MTAMWRVGSNDASPSVPDQSLWETLTQDVQDQPPHRMREQGADFLLYELLDRTVDKLQPVTKAFSKRLGFMHQHAMHKFPQEWLDELDEIKFELVDLTRSIRPMRQVVRHI